MTAPKWDEVFSRRLPGDLPSAPVQRVPIVRNPVCERDCSGRHEIEARIGCATCGVAFYRLLAHEWSHQEGHYFYSQEAIHEAPPGLTACPRCGSALQRMR